MQSVRNHDSDIRTAYARTQPREDRLRMPGQPQPQRQMRMRSQPNLRASPRRNLPEGRTYAAEHPDAYKTPRVILPPIDTRPRPKHDAMYLTSPPFERPDSPESDSENPMGVLDYYLQASYPSPLHRVTSAEEPRPRDVATHGFDFGLEQQSKQYKTQAHYTYTPSTQVEQPRREQPLARTPPSPPRQATRPQYTLFPKEQPTTPRHSLHSDNGSLAASPQSPSAAARTRKSSYASSERSRTDSCMSVRVQPTANFSSPCPSSPSHRSSRIRTSTASSQQHFSMACRPPSRWSGETVDVPLSASMSVCVAAGIPVSRPAEERERDRDSSSTLVSSSNSTSWPTGSFFEDDEDEEKMPLRKKVAERLKSSRSSNGLRSMLDGGHPEPGHKKSPSWARRLINSCRS